MKTHAFTVEASPKVHSSCTEFRVTCSCGDMTVARAVNRALEEGSAGEVLENLVFAAAAHVVDDIKAALEPLAKPLYVADAPKSGPRVIQCWADLTEDERERLLNDLWWPPRRAVDPARVTP